MRSRLPLALTALAFALVVALAGCDSTGDAADASGTFRVLLTDAPGDFLEAVVTIDEVYLQAQEGDDDPAGSRVVLRDEPVTVDLLTLQNEVLDLVGEEEVPEGAYAQLRLVISGGYVAVEADDGAATVYASSDAYAAAQGVEADGRLQMPSYAHSGLKIILPEDAAVVDGDQNVIVLDFDVAESFGQQAGNSGMWVMRPTVRATDLAFTGEVTLSLSLADGVTLPSDTLSLADFSAALDKGGDVLTVPFADADGDGTFTVDFRYLAPETYPVDLVAPAGVAVETDPALPLGVTARSGESVPVSLLITAAEG